MRPADSPRRSRTFLPARSAAARLLGTALLAALLPAAPVTAQTAQTAQTAPAAGASAGAAAEATAAGLGAGLGAVGAEAITSIPFLDLTLREARTNQELALSLQLLLLLAVLSLAPSIVILMTSFLRLAIVLQFVKRALSLAEMPPNQVLMGVALFLTAFIMWPTFEAINRDALQPFARGELQGEQMLLRAEAPVREFMFRQLGNDADNIRLFMHMRDLPKPSTRADVPTYILIPAFILHELTVAFKIGILILIPFVIIDMVVATTLISMGIIVLPPVLISLPFKLVLFVLVDGWDLLVRQLIESFR
ncbi:MAG: flagellar type III secretion system pore protein FliP [Spirochaetaceae bacterium]|nr:flagellar type III secretion system pore protein FliP [Spirochaetaceae bacterium]